MKFKFFVLSALLSLGFSSAVSAQQVLCVNDFTGCVHGTIAPGGGGGAVTLSGNNAFTGNNSFAGASAINGLATFRTDPVVSSGGSSTTGAIFFGTNLGSRYISYDPTLGGTGGYGIGGTTGASDTVYMGPFHTAITGGGGVTVQAGASGAWTLTLPTSGGTNGQVLTTNGSGTTSWVTAGAGDVTQAGNNAFTGNNSFTTGNVTFNQDPTVSSGGSSTTGAIFFGTNLGSRYISYDPTLGGTGGYGIGGTTGASDTVYMGPFHTAITGGGGVTVQAGASGAWTLTLPTSGGTNGQVLTTNGSGTTSWAAPAAGTPANPTATAGPSAINGSATTYMRSDAASAVQQASSSQKGIVQGDGSTLTISSGVASVTNPIGPFTASGGANYFAMPGGAYFEMGGATTTSGSVTITWPHALSAGVTSFVATLISNVGFIDFSSCSTTACTVFTYDYTGAPLNSGFTWMMVGH